MIAAPIQEDIRRPERSFIDFVKPQPKPALYLASPERVANSLPGRGVAKSSIQSFLLIDKVSQNRFATEVRSMKAPSSVVSAGKSWVQDDTIANVLAAQVPAIGHCAESTADMGSEISRRILAVLNSTAAAAANRSVGEVSLLTIPTLGNVYCGDRAFWVRISHDLNLSPFAAEGALNLVARDLHAWLLREGSAQFYWGRLELRENVISELWEAVLLPSPVSVPTAFRESMDWDNERV